MVVLYLKSDWVWLVLSLSSVYLSRGGKEGKHVACKYWCLLVTECCKLMGDTAPDPEGVCSYSLLKYNEAAIQPVGSHDLKVSPLTLHQSAPCPVLKSRHSSVGYSTCYSCQGPEFCSLHPTFGGSQLPV